MTVEAIGIKPENLEDWLADIGPSLGIRVGERKGLARCWAQHPETVHELTGLFLAWKGLIAAFPTDPRGPGAVAAPGPRDWLDLSNSSAPAIARAIAATSTCARAGHHIQGVESAAVA